MELDERSLILSPTKVQTFMTCPRMFFFMYILGWVTEAPSYHATFGTALHKALEFTSRNGLTADAVAAAYEVFLEEYRKTEPPSKDVENAPKDPQTALSALTAYAINYKERQENERLVLAETGGSVLISSSPSRVLYFRFDSLVEDERGYVVRDYKTASRLDKKWMDQWLQKMQLRTYLHAAKSYYSAAKVWGVEVRGIFLYKSSGGGRTYGNVEFIDVPVRPSTPSMAEWLYLVNYYVSSIEENVEIMLSDGDKRQVMRAFPKNTESCTKYGTCPYLEVCASRTNPLRNCERPPAGFVVSFWDPREYADPSKRSVLIIKEEGEKDEATSSKKSRSSKGTGRKRAKAKRRNK